MTWTVPVLGFWIAFLCGLIGYFGRKKKFAGLFQTTAVVVAFLSLIAFLWWGVLRMIGAV